MRGVQTAIAARTAMGLIATMGLVSGTAAWAAEPSLAERGWPQWRGPEFNGVSRHADPPVEWNEDRNIRWKVEPPGSGLATPIVWGEHVYLLSAVPTDRDAPQVEEPQRRRRGGDEDAEAGTPRKYHKLVVLAYERKTGKLAWEQVATEAAPHESLHPDSTMASASPVTDGEHLFAYFGSYGLYCFTMDGKRVWEKDFGDMQTRRGFGEGSSPALYGDTILVKWDHEGPSFIVALDKQTGEERWRQARDEQTSWTTPLIVDAGGKVQVVAVATERTRSYDLRTGELLWECGGQTQNTIPSPVYGDGLLFAISGFRGSAAQAIRLAAAKGDISESDAVVWRYDADTPYVPSALLYDRNLYFFKVNQGILTCLDAHTGEKRFTERVEGIKGVYASPVGAKGRVYLVGREGTTVVLKHEPAFEVLATNPLDDHFDASPALADGELYLRGRKKLYCVASEK